MHGSLHVDLTEWSRIVDLGDVAAHPTSRETTFAAVEARLRKIVDHGAIPRVLAGAHSLLLPELRAVASRHEPVALVQIDAHGDLHDLYYGDERYTSGTIVRRVIEEA